MSMERYLRRTRLLDFDHPRIVRLVESEGWESLDEEARIRGTYNFVRNRIPFGYNASDDIPASQVLEDGHGQCNTKGALLMALLRAGGVPCRFHGFAIDKELQKGVIPGYLHRLAPWEILHSWVEVFYGNRWINLEGFIIDEPYLRSVQGMFPDCEGSFCGYGIATTNLDDPPVEWTGGNTYIQKEGIVRDFGIFDSPDEFYEAHGSNLRGLRRILFVHVGRRLMNRNVGKIRKTTGGSLAGATPRPPRTGERRRAGATSGEGAAR